MTSKFEIAEPSLKAAVNKALDALDTSKDGGRVRLVGVVDEGVIGGRVELTFAKETPDGRLIVGSFAEFTAKGDRRLGGVVQWEW